MGTEFFCHKKCKVYENICGPHKPMLPIMPAEGRTLKGLGIDPEAYESFVPGYLYRFRKTGQYAGYAKG